MGFEGREESASWIHLFVFFDRFVTFV